MIMSQIQTIPTFNDIKTAFNDYLDENYYINQNGKIEIFWDYSDGLSNNQMKVLFEWWQDCKEDFGNYESKTLEDIITHYIFAEKDDWIDDYSDWTLVNKFIAYYEKEYDISIEEIHNIDDLRDDLINWLHTEFNKNHYYLDLNVKTLLANSEKPEDLTLYFKSALHDNWDDLYYSESGWEFIDPETGQSIVEGETVEDTLCQSILYRLILSQGYTIVDLYNEEKRNSSDFLKSVYEELYSYANIEYMDGYELVAIPDTSDWSQIFNLLLGKKMILTKGTKFGLFNRVHGSGSGLNVTLDCDMVLDMESALYEIGIAEINEDYNYSPAAVYGFDRNQKDNQLVTLTPENPDQLELFNDKTVGYKVFTLTD